MTQGFHAADYCPTCGQVRETGPATVERFGLSIAADSVLSFGLKSIRVTPAIAEFIRILIARGKASREFLQLRISPETESNCIDVYACRLRRLIPELSNGALTVRTVWGWGYALDVAVGSAAAA